MQGSVISVKTSDTNRTLVTVELALGNEKKKYTVSEGTYREIGCPLSGDILDEDELELLEHEFQRREAMKKALRILAYADNNKKNLYRKLVKAGYSTDNATYTVNECVRLGYVDEERQLERLITLACNRDLNGPSKIYARLLAKGYRAADITEAIARLTRLGEINFTESKKILLSRKDPATREEKQKILYKYGYKNEND